MSHVEKICRDDRSVAYRKWLKRQTHRAMRRAGKLLDDAPTKTCHLTQGYST